MSAAHAFIINDKFLINSPHFTLPGQTAERGRRHGLDMLGKRNSGGARVSSLSNGGAEEKVAETGQVGFFACFAGCGCRGGALRGGGLGVAREDAGVAGPAIVVWGGGGAAERAWVAACATRCAI
jgi:hypothetical protein